MPTFEVTTPARKYYGIVKRGIIAAAAQHLPPKHGKIFVVTTHDVWEAQGLRLGRAFAKTDYDVLYLPGGEENKRLEPLERLAEEMVARGGDRTSVVVAFGGGIAGDMAGFLAAIFMRGIPVLQIPTTLLAQVDASLGGKTGVNLVSGKNLIGSFHQPLAVLIDPAVLETLPEREFRAGLYEVIKYGVIASAPLFDVLAKRRDAVLAGEHDLVDYIIAESVRIKAEVVSADEREWGLRRILNFGHTLGHALEAETKYARVLHGEAVAFGMKAAGYLAASQDMLGGADAARIAEVIDSYGPIPELDGIEPEALERRLVSDKKTMQGAISFVLPVRIGEVTVRTGIARDAILAATARALRARLAA